MQLAPWEAYDEASRNYFDSYESISFSKTHRAFLRFLPEKGANCLDVGAGSGRDASAMAKRGYRITAVEPSRGLRTLAQFYHTGEQIRWIDDRLPDLSKVVAQGDRYKFILLSAVWMHIQPQNRLTSLKTLSLLLDTDGCIAISLRIGEPCKNRIMYPVSTEELLNQANQVGLKPIYVSRITHDLLNRSEVAWEKVVLTNKASIKNK